MLRLRPDKMLVGSKDSRTPRLGHVPSYMQPTRSSKMKENLYGTEFKFVPRKVTKEPPLTPKAHGMDYIPRIDPLPGVPSFMRQTSTSKGKVAAQAPRLSRSRSVQRKQSSRIESINEFHVFNKENNVIVEKFESILQSINFYQPQTQDPEPAVPLDDRKDDMREKRRRSYSYVTPNPALLATRDGTASPVLTYRAEAEKVKAIQSAPHEDSAHEDSSESQFSTFSPSTRLNGTSNRPPAIPRYMMPTTSSAARVRH